MIEMKCEQSPTFARTITLNDGTYRFDFIYNQYGRFYSMSVTNPKSEVIISGVKLIIGVDLLRPFRHTGLSSLYLTCSKITSGEVSYETIADFSLIYGL